jgi:hypothetical protein
MNVPPLVAYVNPSHVVLQRAKYIEDGWLIKIFPQKIELWEVPQYGSGDEYLVEEFSSVEEAYKYATEKLT